jgi:hypothetical protein
VGKQKVSSASHFHSLFYFILGIIFFAVFLGYHRTVSSSRLRIALLFFLRPLDMRLGGKPTLAPSTDGVFASTVCVMNFATIRERWTVSVIGASRRLLSCHSCLSVPPPLFPCPCSCCSSCNPFHNPVGNLARCQYLTASKVGIFINVLNGLQEE